MLSLTSALPQAAPQFLPTPFTTIPARPGRGRPRGTDASRSSQGDTRAECRLAEKASFEQAKKFLKDEDHPVRIEELRVKRTKNQRKGVIKNLKEDIENTQDLEEKKELQKKLEEQQAKARRNNKIQRDRKLKLRERQNQPQDVQPLEYQQELHPPPPQEPEQEILPPPVPQEQHPDPPRDISEDAFSHILPEWLPQLPDLQEQMQGDPYAFELPDYTMEDVDEANRNMPELDLSNINLDSLLDNNFNLSGIGLLDPGQLGDGSNLLSSAQQQDGPPAIFPPAVFPPAAFPPAAFPPAVCPLPELQRPVSAMHLLEQQHPVQHLLQGQQVPVPMTSGLDAYQFAEHGLLLDVVDDLDQRCAYLDRPLASSQCLDPQGLQILEYQWLNEYKV